MKKRIFLCGFYNFPRGSASSNYVQYMSIALVTAGYEVHLVTNVNHDENEYKDKLINRLNNKLIIHEIEKPGNKYMKYIQFHYTLGNEITRQLKKQGICQNDIIITYTNRKLINKAVYRYARSCNAKIGTVIVEWYAREDFSSKKSYLEYSSYFENEIPKFDFVIPISSYICDFFKEKGVNTFILPVIEDPYEYERKKKDYSEKIRVIYPANGMMKDAIADMLKAIDILNMEEQNSIEFHFCGIKQEMVENILGRDAFVRLSHCIKLHSWMSYDELIELYRSCHFLLLARKTRHMTKANFPGKVPEVMVHGVVPIVSVVGDYTKFYLKNDINSIFMEGYDSSVIYDALSKAIKLSQSEHMKMSDQAYETVCEELSYEKWAVRLREFFEKV